MWHVSTAGLKQTAAAETTSGRALLSRGTCWPVMCGSAQHHMSVTAFCPHMNKICYLPMKRNECGMTICWLLVHIIRNLLLVHTRSKTFVNAQHTINSFARASMFADERGGGTCPFGRKLRLLTLIFFCNMICPTNNSKIDDQIPVLRLSMYLCRVTSFVIFVTKYVCSHTCSQK